MDADADDVARRHGRQVDLLERLVDDLRDRRTSRGVAAAST